MKDLDFLYNELMTRLMKEKAKTYNFEGGMTFFSNKEFIENEPTITSITGAYQRLQKKLDNKS